jgi:hypothetical protein
MTFYVMTCCSRWQTPTHGMQTLWITWFQAWAKRGESYNSKANVTFGMTVSVSGLFGWPAEKMRANIRGTTNHWKMPCSTVLRPLWSTPHTSQNLVVQVLLVDDVRGHQGIHPKVSEVLVPRKHQLLQRDAPTFNFQIKIFNVWGINFMGPFQNS